ncbi:MAG: PorT family protein [Bacteroidales bacterium]|nr:PorT family protein [Bacteroidales bacterium]
MKKIIILLAFLSVSLCTYAQMGFGVKAYANASNVSNGYWHSQYPDNIVPKMGFGLGGFIEFKNLFAPRWGLKGELLFNTVGERARFSNSESFTTRLTYINLPVMAQYKVYNDRLSFVAGPQFGFCLGAKDILRSGMDKHIEPLHNTEYNVLELGFVFGVSYLFYPHFGIEARYNLGLTNVYTNYGEPTGQNHFVNLGFIYEF